MIEKTQKEVVEHLQNKVIEQSQNKVIEQSQNKVIEQSQNKVIERSRNERSQKALIIGQGIAGTMIAWRMEQRNIDFTIISQPLKNTCSYLAAGLINPVTGRKFVKSWMTDQLFEVVEKTYPQIESVINEKILHKISFLRDFANPGEENAWVSRCEDPAYKPYIRWKKAEKIEGARFNYESIYGITNGFRIDTHTLLTGMRERWLKRGNLIEATWDIQEQDLTNGIRFRNTDYDHIVYCVGAHPSNILYFDKLPLVPNAGEFLIVQIDDLDTDYFLKRHKVLVSLGNNKYWFGATYDWDCKSTIPTLEGKQQLIEALESFISCPYTILEHHLGIRPTVKNRRPLIGTHPEMNHVHYFNGFGTKGYSLTPYWSEVFVEETFVVK